MGEAAFTPDDLRALADKVDRVSLAWDASRALRWCADVLPAANAALSAERATVERLTRERDCAVRTAIDSDDDAREALALLREASGRLLGFADHPLRDRINALLARREG